MFLNYLSFNDLAKLICLLYLKKWSFLRENTRRVEDAVSLTVKVQRSYIKVMVSSSIAWVWVWVLDVVICLLL